MTVLRDKVILLTGAGGGLGIEMVSQFLQEGSLLVLSDHPSVALTERIKSIKQQASTAGRILGIISMDLSDSEGCLRLWEACQSIHPSLDILVNNAGIALLGPHHLIPSEKWEKLMQINLLSPMRLTQLVVPHMIQRRSGHIVNISSVAGQVGPPNLASYAASKFGLRGFGEALSEELLPHDVFVTQIYPFFTRTPILDSQRFGGIDVQVPDNGPIYEPAFVIRELIQGIKRNQLHVFPGAIPKAIVTTHRFFPSLVPYLSRLSMKRINKPSPRK